MHPSDLLKGRKPRLFDEWQDAPEIWGAIRKDVDDSGEVGQYILTGSSSKDVQTPHTGTKYGYKREDGVYVIPIGCLKN